MPPSVITPVPRVRRRAEPVVPAFAPSLVAALYEALATRDVAAFRGLFAGPDDADALLASRDRRAKLVVPNLGRAAAMEAWFLGQAEALAPLELPCPDLILVPRHTSAAGELAVHNLGVTFLGLPLQFGLRILERPTRHCIFTLRAARQPEAAVDWQPIAIGLGQVVAALADEAAHDPVPRLEAFAEAAAGPLAAGLARVRAAIDVAPLADPVQPSAEDLARVEVANTLAYICESLVRDFGASPGERQMAYLRARKRVGDAALVGRLQSAYQRIEALVALPAPPPGQEFPDQADDD